MRSRAYVRKVSCAALLLSSLNAPASISVESRHATTPYAVSGSDLLQGRGLLTDTTQLAQNVPESAGYTAASLTDGLFPSDDRAFAIAGGVLTYTLDTTLNTAGYDVAGLATYGGWANWGRSQQKYSVACATVSDPTNFVPLASNVDSGYYVADAPSYTAVWITNTTGLPVATNVKALRFTFPTQLNGGAGYREFDVFGSPSGITQTNAPLVLYRDSFTRQGGLSGSSPDEGAAKWTAAPAWLLDGSRARVTANNRLAFLPFQPRSNNIYTLSATVHCTNATPVYEWLAVGFANGMTTDGSWHMVNNPAGWMLLRYQSDSNNPAQAFLGPGAAGGAGVGVLTGPRSLAVVLDTRAASATNWTLEFKIDGATVRGPVRVGAAAPLISSLGIGNGAGTGWVDDFQLTAAKDDAAYQLEEIAASIRAVTTPMRGSTTLRLPEVPLSYSLSIKYSSRPDVVALNGTVAPPATNVVLSLVLSVKRMADQQTADTQTIKLFVPAARGSPTFVPYADHFAMRRGLFIHWSAPPDGQSNPIVFSNGGRSATIDQFTTSVNVPAVADQVASLGFEYVLLTDFHGYQTTLHPCAALDSWRGPGCTSTRDLVGELITALKARGIRTYLFTHPLDGYDGYTPEQQALVGWNDPTGGYRRWNDFINDVFAELTERYGDDLAGIGFDSEFGMAGWSVTYQKLDLARLRNTIVSRRPGLGLSALAGPNDTAEFGMKEVWRPSWLDPWDSRPETDYNSETWPAYRRVVAIVQGYHWTTITPPSGGLARLTGAQMYRYGVLQAAVSTEGPGVAWAATPYTDGTWENGVGPEFEKLRQLEVPRLESLRDVLPSASFPRGEGDWISTLPEGAVALRSRDGVAEYIHVLNPPAGGVLSLPFPADGKRFLSGALLMGGQEVQLSTNAGKFQLTLPAGASWDTNDTVIKLLADPASVPRPNFALHKPVAASSSTEFGPSWGTTTPWGRIRLVDGQLNAIPPAFGWSAGNYGFTSIPSNVNHTAWVAVDLQGAFWLSQVRLHPRADSGNLGQGFPIAFQIQTSEDGMNWTAILSRSNEPRPTTAQAYSFPTRAARHVRLHATQLRPNPNAGNEYRLALADLEVFGFISLSPLEIRQVGDSTVLQWTNGVLQSAESVDGAFADVPGATSPWTNSATLPIQFFRLKY